MTQALICPHFQIQPKSTRRPVSGILGAVLNDGAEDMRDEARARCEPSAQRGHPTSQPPGAMSFPEALDWCHSVSISQLLSPEAQVWVSS